MRSRPCRTAWLSLTGLQIRIVQEDCEQGDRSGEIVQGSNAETVPIQVDAAVSPPWLFMVCRRFAFWSRRVCLACLWIMLVENGLPVAISKASAAACTLASNGSHRIIE